MNVKEMLFSDNIKDRLISIEYIAENKLNGYAKDLFSLLKYEKDLMVQEAIINTLKHLELEKVPDEIFLELLLNEELLLKEFALSLLSINKRINILGKLLENEDKDIRKYALDGLYRTNDKEAIKYIAKCLDDQDINNQIAAIEYLGLLGAKEYSEKIANILQRTNNQFLLTTILETLSLIGDDKSDNIVKEKINDFKKVHLIIPFAKYVFKRSNVFESIDFFENCEYKHLIIKEFLDYLYKNHKKIYPYTKLKNKVIKELIELLKYKEYIYDILTLINLLDQDEIDKIILENINELNSEGIIAVIEIINERKLKSFKDILQKIKNKFSDEIKMIIEETIMEMETW
ncbi:HEAT repeat domain-containing protein [Marinitoga sp. 38H-ov]|uniref:HEAT repeat domain-containing protein n=1 Tax=Marinitoga sp. 38H-ov TaxID=1755814 RepID=UPI0013ED901D|nr:HEAT repeat domain-containing protein [Marinitoga sp. 38H-ov]KAF2955198.1 hypothetical protein AS160_01475 [Marinitoga sp. 38H-ov]